jgi:hypothetical protein
MKDLQKQIEKYFDPKSLRCSCLYPECNKFGLCLSVASYRAEEAERIILALQQQIKERDEATNLLISRAMDMGEYIYIPIDDYDTALLSLLGNAGTCRYCGKKIGLSDYRGADVTGAFHVSCQSEALGTTHTAALPKEGV